MKPFQITALLSVLTPLTSAAPSADYARTTSLFRLQTVAVNSSKYDGLTVFPAHTYAGGNVPGLFKSSKGAIASYLDNGALLFDFPEKEGGLYPFGLTYTDYAAAWFECTISTGTKPIKHEFQVGKDGYLITYEKNKIVRKGVEETINKTFQGAYWRVCKWVCAPDMRPSITTVHEANQTQTHGYPELFLNNPESSNNEDPSYVPDNCALVNLKVIYYPH